MHITEGQSLVLQYEQWRASRDPSSKEINEVAFTEWYELILDTIRSMERIPKPLLDDFSKEIWFGASHGHNYLRSRCVHPDTFKMRSQKIVLIEVALHSENGSWSGVAYDITEEKYRYLFCGLKPQSQAREEGESSRKRPVEEDIHPMVLQMEQQMFVIR